MTDAIHIGCADLPQRCTWERYFRKLRFVETSVLRSKPARPSVLARWRQAAPGPGAFAVVAPDVIARPLGTATTQAVAALSGAIAALEASVVVFRTPPTFSPSAGNRDLLREFFAGPGAAERFGSARRVWHPDGLWDVRTAVKLANELGVVLGADPLLRDPTRDPPDFFATLETDALYLRPTGLGRGARRLSSAQLEELAEVATAYPQAWVVFATVDALADANRFGAVAGEFAAFEGGNDDGDVGEVDGDDDDDDDDGDDGDDGDDDGDVGEVDGDDDDDDDDD